MNENASDAWVYLAEGFVGLDEIDNALIAYLKSISIEPDQPDTVMAIANIWLEKGEYKKAIEYYLTAQQMDETLEHVNLFVAVAYYKKGDVLKAISYLLKAINKNESAKELFFELCPEASDILL